MKDESKTKKQLIGELADLRAMVARLGGAETATDSSGMNPELFKNIIDYTNDALFVIDPRTGRFLLVNDRACQNLGYDRGELLKMGVTDIEAILPDHFSWKEHIKEVRSGGGMILEGEHKRKDATTFPVEVSVRFHSQDKNDYMVAIARDITLRKQREEELQKSDLYINTMGDALIVANMQRQVIKLNKAALELLGYSQEESTSLTFEKLFPEKEHERHYAEMDNAIKTGIVRKLESPMLLKGGKEIPVLLSGAVMRDTEGKPIGFVSVIRDITKRKRMEEELLLKSTAIESSVSGIGITDLEGKIIFVNEACINMWGYKNKDEIVGRDLPDFWEGERVYQTIKNLKEKGMDKGEDIGKRKDGSLFNLLFTANLIKDKNGEPIAMLGSFMDITEHKQADEELKQKSQELETLTENLRKLSAQLSKEEEFTRRKFARILHEQVGQTLVAIKMKCHDVFEETFLDTSEIKKAIYDLMPILNDAIRSTRELTSDLYPTIIDDLGFIPAVNWNKDQILKQKELKVSLDINKAVEDLSPETKLSLFYIVQEAFQNISKHAFATEVKVKLTKVGKTLNLSIEDNGVGFDTEEIKQKRDKGIGLMLMKERSLSSGWVFKLESASGKGTEIRIEIPIKQ